MIKMFALLIDVIFHIFPCPLIFLKCYKHLGIFIKGIFIQSFTVMGKLRDAKPLILLTEIFYPFLPITCFIEILYFASHISKMKPYPNRVALSKQVSFYTIWKIQKSIASSMQTYNILASRCS